MNSLDLQISAIALDMIGVLVKEEKLISRGFPAFFGDRLRLPLSDLKERYDHGYCIGALTSEEFWQGALDEDWRHAEYEFLTSRKFAADAVAAISELSEQFELAVVSDMPREWAQTILAHHGVAPLINVGVFSNDGKGSKKDGGLFAALVAGLARPASEILLIDDRPRNLDRAASEGLHGIYLPLDPEDAELRPDLIRVDSLNDAVRLLIRDTR